MNYYARLQHTGGSWFPGDTTVLGESCIQLTSLKLDLSKRLITIVPRNPAVDAVFFAKALVSGEHLPHVEIEATEIVAYTQHLMVKHLFTNSVITKYGRTGNMAGPQMAAVQVEFTFEKMTVVYGPPFIQSPGLTQPLLLL
ncbi:MAG TPA: hypothetical protein VG456_19425 [Candidatus Sulfopaludibacter sp.]|jgi:hypothetical protein|nr:hypothetical protein [Candidatus Sulfopaludibacter sp.]